MTDAKKKVSAVYDKVASRARGSIILVKVRNQQLLRDGYVRDLP